MTGTRWQSFVVNGVVERVSTTPVPLRRDTDTVSTAYRAPPSSSRRASDDASDLGLLSLGASLRCRRKTKKESQKPPAADDGAPAGKSYQAESPDEGTLVSAAATVYGVRLVDRRTDGLVLSHDRPCPLRRNDVVAALKEGRLGNVVVPGDPDNRTRKEEEEVWRVLAVNKFNSDRKRMLVLVRSPPTSGSLPMVLCKLSCWERAR